MLEFRIERKETFRTYIGLRALGSSELSSSLISNTFAYAANFCSISSKKYGLRSRGETPTLIIRKMISKARTHSSCSSLVRALRVSERDEKLRTKV